MGRLALASWPTHRWPSGSSWTFSQKLRSQENGITNQVIVLIGKGLGWFDLMALLNVHVNPVGPTLAEGCAYSMATRFQNARCVWSAS